jgi:hypothetical protein
VPPPSLSAGQAWPSACLILQLPTRFGPQPATHHSSSSPHCQDCNKLMCYTSCPLALPSAVRCNVAFNLGATEPWTPASTPLHFAAAGRGRVVQAILQAAAEQDQEAVAQGRHTIDIRLLSDFRGKAQQHMSGQSQRAVCGLLRECGRRCSTMLHSFPVLSQSGPAHPC